MRTLIFIFAILPILLQAQITEQTPDSLTTYLYIEIAGKDSVYREKAEIHLDHNSFNLIRGLDTLSRKVYSVDGPRYRLSCGDYVKVDRHPVSLKAKGFHYLEKYNYWYFSKHINAIKQ